MANKTITIIKKYADHTLQLSDNGHTKTTGKSVITWKIGRGSGVAAITSIEPKAHSVNVFKIGDPKPVQGNTKWKGEIKNFSTPAVEEYSIGYTDDNNRPHVFDPKISVNTTFSFFSFKKNLLLLALSFLALFAVSALFTRKNNE